MIQKLQTDKHKLRKSNLFFQVTKEIETILLTDKSLTDTLTDLMFFYFSPTAHYLKTILYQPQMANMVLPYPQANPPVKP